MKPILTRFALLLGILGLYCLNSLSFAASIGICHADIEIREGMSIKEFYSATGERQLLIQSDSALDPALCESTSLAQPLESILWSALLPAQLELRARDQLILQGSFSADAAAISEIIVPEPPSPPSDTPNQLATALGDFDSVLFGVEERAQWLEGTQLVCGAGDSVAGIQLKANEFWPENGRLLINASGTGDFRIAIADEQRIANEATVPIGTLTLGDDDTVASHEYALPDNPTAWQAITIICPLHSASLRIYSIVLQPAQDSSVNSSRTAWLWNPSTWLNDPSFFWTLQNLESVNEFYITVPVNTAGEVANASELAGFIREANARDVRIWAVIGDRHDVLPESLAPLQTRISAYRRYNMRVAVAEQLAGVQLDIEPYLLPGHTLAKDLWRDRYLQTVSTAKQVAGDSLHVDLVMPVWWGDHENWGPKLLDELKLPGISLTIMNYRTDYQQLLSGMTPFLEWGVSNDQQVRVALETGSLSDETQRAYARNSYEGELWRLQIGATPILVLFNQAQQNLVGAAFSQRFERVFSADKLTFAGDQQRLNETSHRLSEELRAWSSFAGMALHGLDEVYADQLDE